MADIRDLLIRMSLDTSTFKTNIADAKRELRTLKSEYKEISSSDDIGQGGARLLENLREQKTAAEALVQEYQTGIEEIRRQLDAVPTDSQAAGQLQRQVQSLEDGLARAKTQVNDLQTQINSVRLDTFIAHAETIASTINSLKIGLGDLTDFARQTANAADTANVSREAAFISATKNVEDIHQTQDDLNVLNDTLREMSTRIPQTYQQLAGLMGVGATLGVPYEDLEKFTEVMAKLNVATNVDGEGGAQAMAQFLNITEKSFANLDRVGSTLTELGNNSATTEQAILEMSHRAATGLAAVGMTAQDILAVSAAINSVGIEAQAGGSAISKLGITMDKAANVGGQQTRMLLDTWGDAAISSIYDLYAKLDSLPSAEGWKSFADSLGMTASDTKALMNSALAAERFSQAMGQTVDEFAAGWNQDSANQMLNFFRALGEMDGTGEAENMLWTMDQLGIKEIRQSNMVRALAGNWELYEKMLGLARDAYEENIALENEANRAFSTNESRRVINENKEQNALEAMGETVTAMRKPWEDFFGDLQQWYADWPGWAQTAVGVAAETTKGLGDLLSAAGQASFDILAISKAIKEIENSTIGAALIKGLGAAGSAIGSAAAAIAPPVAVGLGTLGLGVALDKASTEANYADLNRAMERQDEILAESVDEHVTRLQELFASFAQAIEQYENNEDPLSDHTQSFKEAFRQNANELLQEMPDLKFWDSASFYADLRDGLDPAEIESIINGLNFGIEWVDLGNEAVTGLAGAIQARQQELYAAAQNAGLQLDAGMAQGIYDGAAQAIDAAAWLAGEVENQLRVDLDIHSPSGVARALGQYFTEGFAEGVQAGIGRVEESVNRLTQTVSARRAPQGGKAPQRLVPININLSGKTLAQSLAPLLDQVMGEYVL